MRILFITATRIGDAVLTTGLLSYLIDRHPDARFTVAAGPAAAALFESAPRLGRVIVLRKKAFAAHWVMLWAQCVGTRWDMVVDLRRSVFAWLLRAESRHVVPLPGRPMHRVECIAETLGRSESPPAPTCWTSPSDDAAARALVPDGGPVLAIGAAANWPGKQWRAGNFAELIGRLTAAHGILPMARVAVFGAAAERDQVQAVLDSIPTERRIDLVGRTGLPVAAACLRRCALYIGNDSGLMHLAAAAGTPTLGLFGPSQPAHYAPWGPDTGWVRTRRSYDELVGAPGYDHRATGTLMDSLSVDMAEAAAVDLWHRVHPAAATGGSR